jgi:polyhydroxyalkanoate synthesis regulator phasin
MSRSLLSLLAVAALAVLPPAGRAADQPVKPKPPVPAVTPAQIAALQAQYNRLTAQVEVRKTELHRLEAQLRTMQEQLTKLQAEIQQATKANEGRGQEETQEETDKPLPPEIEKRLREMEKKLQMVDAMQRELTALREKVQNMPAAMPYPYPIPNPNPYPYPIPPNNHEPNYPQPKIVPFYSAPGQPDSIDKSCPEQKLPLQ